MNLTGKCLVARPEIKDSLFKKSVVFIYENAKQGTAGLILNKPNHSINTRELCMHRGYDVNVPQETVYAGGPVNSRATVMLHSADWEASNTMRIDNQISISSDDLMIYRYTQGDTPRYYRFYTGLSVWHPQQIIAETNKNHWLVTDIDCETIFETDARHLWDIAVEQAAQSTMDRFI